MLHLSSMWSPLSWRPWARMKVTTLSPTKKSWKCQIPVHLTQASESGGRWLFLNLPSKPRTFSHRLLAHITRGLLVFRQLGSCLPSRESFVASAGAAMPGTVTRLTCDILWVGNYRTKITGVLTHEGSARKQNSLKKI